MSQLGESCARLQQENSRLDLENRSLADQLDLANTAILDADKQIKSLEQTLSNTQNDMQRLKQLAWRTESLESQLEEVEIEQAKLQDEMYNTREGAKDAEMRWRESEKTVEDLYHALEQIEQDREDEKKEHEGRIALLKRATSYNETRYRSVERHEGTREITKNLVKQLLEDNTQLRIRERDLNGLLARSSDENDQLRERLDGDERRSRTPIRHGRSLSEELEEASQRVLQDLHVPHHVRTPTVSSGSTLATSPTDDTLFGAHPEPIKLASVPNWRQPNTVELRAKPSVAMLHNARGIGSGALRYDRGSIDTVLRSSLAGENVERPKAYKPLRDTFGWIAGRG